MRHALSSQVVDDDVLVISTSWPATTIDGNPGIVSGTLSVSRAAGGEFLLNVSVGPADAAPEDVMYVEFPLSAEHAQALRTALA